MAHPLFSPSLSSLPVSEGDFPFVLSGPKTQYNLELEILMGTAIEGEGNSWQIHEPGFLFFFS